MKKHILIIILLALSVGFISVNAEAGTVATFADPNNSAAIPLFTVDFRPAQMKLTGGWAYGNTGLTLEIPYSGHTFTNAWFEMTGTNSAEVGIINTFGDTEGGEINFYAYGTTTNPLLTVSFESGFVSRYGFGAEGVFLAGNVTIEGSEITGELSEEEFSFSFANKKRLSANPNDGFTATAAFTSSAVIPEPATLCLLGLGALNLLRIKRGR